MTKHSILLTLAIGGMVVLGAPAAAQQTFETPEAAIKYRKDTFKEMQQNFKRVADMAGGKAEFDAKVAEESAARAAEMIKLPWAGFGPGTEGGKSKPNIWKEEAKFKAAADLSEVEVAKLAAAAKTGSLDAIKAAMRGAGGSCKSCHDDFKEK